MGDRIVLIPATKMGKHRNHGTYYATSKSVAVSRSNGSSCFITLHGISDNSNLDVLYLTPYEFLTQVPMPLRNSLPYENLSVMRTFLENADRIKTVNILSIKKISGKDYYPSIFFFDSLEITGYVSWSNPAEFYIFPADFSRQVPLSMRQGFTWVDSGKLVEQFERLHGVNRNAPIYKKAWLMSPCNQIDNIHHRETQPNSISNGKLPYHYDKTFTRRGHWHHVWVGARNSKERHLEQRWYSEIIVNSCLGNSPNDT